MSLLNPINLFYEEPDPDRWFKYDRFPRKLIRRIIRGKHVPGGVMMVALELMRGLDRLGIPYRFNDYKYAKNHSDELIGVIGKPHLIFEKRFKNPILFGAGIFSHPSACHNLFQEYPNVKQILVPGNWMKTMFESYYGDKVKVWPVGIDIEKWNPSIKIKSRYDFLIYDKIRWEHATFENTLINPIKAELEKNQLSYTSIIYGKYDHQELLKKLSVSKAVIFLCEHETQGLAYQQILSTNTPILAYDRQDFWLDPEYYPKISYSPVSSVPYWDSRCGLKFNAMDEFNDMLKAFQKKLNDKEFMPDQFILENLSLERCALAYQKIYSDLAYQLDNK